MASYSASGDLNPVFQSPDCGYLISYEAFVIANDGGLIPVDQVYEIAFFPTSKVFAYSKCGKDSDPLDPECAGTQYTKVIPVRLVAKVGVTVISTASLDFNIIIKPDCTKDTIAFNIPLDFGTFPYYVTSPLATPQVLSPTYTQLIPECQVVCDLFENLVKWDPSAPNTIVSSFNYDTGEIVVNTNDLTLDASESLLVVECVSTESTVVSTVGEPDRRDGCDFEIKLFDQCRLA